MGELEKIQVEKHENRHTFVKINRKYTPKSEQMFVFFHKKLREGACKIGKIWHNVFAFARGAGATRDGAFLSFSEAWNKR